MEQSTSATGDFSISVPDNAVLVFTSVGFGEQEMSVGTNSTINLQMKGVAQSLSDVVVVGYGTQKKVTVTGCVTRLKALILTNHHQQTCQIHLPDDCRCHGNAT